jgi:hypothetical protein
MDTLPLEVSCTLNVTGAFREWARRATLEPARGGDGYGSQRKAIAVVGRPATTILGGSRDGARLIAEALFS